MVRRFGLLLGLGLALVAGPSPARGAEDTNRACDNDQDVTIVVDFDSLGGGVNVRCAPQPIKNGFDVFRNANVSYETVSGSDFVCRIAARPGPDTEDCVNTPPGDAYWSYWYAVRGGEWTYSKRGPGARKPPPGSFEGWTFKTGDNAQPPRYPVPGPLTSPTTSAPAPAPAPAPGPTDTTVAPSGGATVTASSPRSPAAVASTTTSPATADATASAPTALSALAGSGADPTTTLPLGNVDLTVRSGDGGSSTGFIVSAASLVGLGATALAFLRRRGR